MDLAERNNVNIKGSVTWAFEFEDQPIFAGFRALASDGIAMPVLDTYRMLNKMGTQRLAVTSSGDIGLDNITRRGVRGANSDVYALASRDDKRITIIAWNYHDDDVPAAAADVTLAINGLPADVSKAKLTEWRVDETHSNAYTAWKQMGAPPKPTAEEHAKIEAASDLAAVRTGEDLGVSKGTAEIKLNMPREAVSLVEVSW
jgi:xylan 1,4-beta-xylosidase